MVWEVSVTPRPHFTRGKNTPSTHWIGGWVGPRACLDTEGKVKIIYVCQGSNPIVQSAVRHYTVWPTPYHFLFYYFFALSCDWLSLPVAKHTAKYIKYLGYSADYRPCWNAKSHSVNREIPCLLCNRRVHDRVHNSLPIVCILSQTNPVEFLTSCLLIILFNVHGIRLEEFTKP
jgi:hypothetical protein